MSNSNAQDRTLPASPRKIEKARKEGQVPRSRDLGHFAALAAAGAVLVATAPVLAAFLRNALERGLRFDRTTLEQTGSMGARLTEQAWTLLGVVLPFGAVMVAAALADGTAPGKRYRVDVPGGRLEVTWTEQGRVELTGPAVLVARGEWIAK